MATSISYATHCVCVCVCELELTVGTKRHRFVTSIPIRASCKCQTAIFPIYRCSSLPPPPQTLNELIDLHSSTENSSRAFAFTLSDMREAQVEIGLNNVFSWAQFVEPPISRTSTTHTLRLPLRPLFTKYSPYISSQRIVSMLNVFATRRLNHTPKLPSRLYV